MVKVSTKDYFFVCITFNQQDRNFAKSNGPCNNHTIDFRTTRNLDKNQERKTQWKKKQFQQENYFMENLGRGQMHTLGSVRTNVSLF